MLDERDAIDRHIDAVARAMSDGEPRADFTIRVMRRIAAPRAPRSHASARLWAPALAAAAVVIIALLWHRPHPPIAGGSAAVVTAQHTPSPAEQQAPTSVRLEPDPASQALTPLSLTADDNPPAMRIDRVT